MGSTDDRPSLIDVAITGIVEKNTTRSIFYSWMISSLLKHADFLVWTAGKMLSDMLKFNAPGGSAGTTTAIASPFARKPRTLTGLDPLGEGLDFGK